LKEVIPAKGNKNTFHWKTNYTISNYCVLFNIGKYVVEKRIFTTVAGNKVPIEFYVLEQDKDKASHVIDLRERDAHILEKYLGEYPWVKEKMGIAQVSNPGMEHQTMITYGDPFNYVRVGGQDYSPNLFHEFGHEWFANKVTNKDWAHMWIQEGINTYSEALCMRELSGEKGYDSMMLQFRKSIRNEKPLVQGEGITSGDTYTGDIYVKGAFFMHTLRRMLGDSIFFPTLKTLATAPEYTYNNFVDSEDVQKLFSKSSGKDLKPLFDFYLRTTNVLEINVSQTGLEEYAIQSKNSPMTLPLQVTTDKGETKITLEPNKRIVLKSKTVPSIDPHGNYLKRVTIN
jgi:aminopeptidase N